MSRQFHPVKSLDHDAAVYLAGIIDGEGCFYIGRSTKPTGVYYQPQFKIALVDETTIAWIADKLGRGYTHQKAKAEKNHKDTYEVRMGRRSELIEFIPQILPYMILKRAVASNLLEFCQQRTAYEKYNTKGEHSMYLSNKNLNKVGVML